MRLLLSHGFCCVSELPLPSGRRADLVALDGGGEIWIVEIKSSVADFRADQKWMDYRMHCDRLFFATTLDVPCEIFPQDTGLIVADAFGGADRLRSARAQAAGGDPQGDDAALRALRGVAAAIADRSEPGLTAKKSRFRNASAADEASPHPDMARSRVSQRERQENRGWAIRFTMSE